MIVDLLIFAVCLAALVYSSDSLIDTVAMLAERLKIPPMVVGLTVVAVGTSLPEVMASVAAAFKGYPEIAVGNVVGSNICNVALVLGFPALFYNINCSTKVIQKEGSIMLFTSVLLTAIGLFSLTITRGIGLVFVSSFFAFITFVFISAKGGAKKQEEETTEIQETEQSSPFYVELLKVASMLVILLASSKFLVDSTVSLATAFGVSEAVIAISLIALGTSLPELSVSVSAARKKQGDILVGNILGSNISNILLVLGSTALVKPFGVSAQVAKIDMPIMLFLAACMYAFLYSEKGINRSRAIVLLTVYGLVILRCIFIGNS